MKTVYIATITTLAALWTLNVSAQPSTTQAAEWSGSKNVALAEAGEGQQSLRNAFTSRRGHLNQAYRTQADSQKWEGATLVVDSEQAEAGNGTLKSNINHFSKRPYMKKAVD